MNLICKSYDTLMSNLQDVATITEDPSSSDATRNIVFKCIKSVNEDGSPKNVIKLIGIGQSVLFIRSLIDTEYELQMEDSEYNANGLFYFQVKSKELLNFLNTYKGLRRSTVESVEFKLNGTQLICKVHEKFTATYTVKKNPDEIQYADANGDEGVSTSAERDIFSQWVFNLVKLSAKIENFLSPVVPDDAEFIEYPKAALQLYADGLLPLLDSNSESAYGNMYFDNENHIYARTSSFTTIMGCVAFMKDSPVFSGIRLPARIFSFMYNIIPDGTEFKTCKYDAAHICIQTDASELIITLSNPGELSIQKYVDLFKKDHFVRVDRLYLKDVLKRLSLSSESIEFEIRANDGENGLIKLSNSSFRQEIALDGKQEMDEYQNIKFKMMPENITKAIIGSDSMYDSSSTNGVEGADIYIYICEAPNARDVSDKTIILADLSGAWYSILRVKSY